MPSLEKIIRPFVVEPTTPPVPYITSLLEPPPDLVRLNIGIGRTNPRNLSPDVAPIVPPTSGPDVTPLSSKPQIQFQKLSSSWSISVQYYRTQTVKEKPTQSGGGGGGNGGNGD